MATPVGRDISLFRRIDGTVWTADATINREGYTPNRFVTVGAAGGGAGTQGDPWTLQEAYQLAQPGDVVQVGPGQYYAPTTNTNRFPSWRPARSGASGSPIVFFAETRAVDAVSTSQMARVHLNGSTGPVTGVNGESYITFDGFDFKQIGAHTFTSEGSVFAIWNSHDIKVLGCLFDQEGFAPTSGTPNWGGVFVESDSPGNVYNIEIADCRFRRMGDNSHTHAIELYDCLGYEIHHCEFYDVHGAIHPKGVYPNQDDLLPASIHHNFISDGTDPIRLGGVGGDHEAAGEYLDIYQNIFVRCNQMGMNRYNTTSPSNFRIVNNLFYDLTVNEGAWYGSGGPAAGNSSYNNSMFRNNIVAGISNGNFYYTYEAGASAAVLASRVDFDRNLYGGISAYVNGGTSFAQWQALGADLNGAEGNPVFVGEGSDDYRLDPGSPGISLCTDVLNLLGGGQSAIINAGPFILPDQSDSIGVRS